MTKLLLASLLALPALALAQPAPPTPPGPPPPGARPHVCKAEGTVLFEIDDNVSTTKLFVDGAFMKSTVDDKGKLTSVVGPGCVEDKDLRRLTKEIHGAEWKVTADRIHCMAVSTAITTFKVGGKTVFTERLCSGEHLDANSEAVLEDASATLIRYTTDPLTGSPGKPVK